MERHCFLLLALILFIVETVCTPSLLNAQTDNNSAIKEDTLSANYESSISCPTIDSIIQFAFSKQPTSKYKYGAAGPNHFDCSGFVFYCFGHYDIALPRSSRDMFLIGEKVDKKDLIPGDLAFFSRGGSSIGHVGIVVETNIDSSHNFRFIHSSTYGTDICVDNSKSPGYASTYKGARRVITCDAQGNLVKQTSKSAWPGTPEHPAPIGQSTILSKDSASTTAAVADSSQTAKDTVKPQPVKPAPVKQQPTSTKKYYKVKRGDTLSAISRKYHVSVTNLKKWNHLKSDMIREGQRLLVHP